MLLDQSLGLIAAEKKTVRILGGDQCCTGSKIRGACGPRRPLIGVESPGGCGIGSKHQLQEDPVWSHIDGDGQNPVLIFATPVSEHPDREPARGTLDHAS